TWTSGPASGSRSAAGAGRSKRRRKSRPASRATRPPRSSPPSDSELAGGIPTGAEGCAFVELGEVAIDHGVLAPQEGIDRIGERRLRDPVAGARADRLESAGELVLALRAAFHMRKPELDRGRDALVVGELEMQAIDPLERAPVTPVEAILVAHQQARCDRAAAARSDVEHAGL